MKKDINLKKTGFFKRIFILLCRKIGYEIIDQSNFHVPTQNKLATENLSSPGISSISIPLGKTKIKRKISDLTIIVRSYTSTENKSKILLTPKGRILPNLLKIIFKNSISRNLRINENKCDLQRKKCYEF